MRGWRKARAVTAYNKLILEELGLEDLTFLIALRLDIAILKNYTIVNQFVSVRGFMKVIEIENANVLVFIVVVKLAPFNQTEVFFSKVLYKLQSQVLPLLLIVLESNHQL
jgi:hypothetical protein